MKRRPGPALIMRLKSGLGNQLFEYASARAIANRNRIPLYFDVESGFLNDPFRRRFVLDRLGISANWLTRREALAFAPPTLKSVYLKRREIIRMRWLSEYHDPSIHSMRIRSPILLENYLQSPLYFMDCAAMIRSDLDDILSQVSTDEPAGVSSEDAVCVHIRRFTDIPQAGCSSAVQRYYGAYGIEYYRASMNLIRTERPSARFYFFGDDPAWIRSNILPLCPHGTVVDTGSDLGDFRMMIKCTHFIIANSTFSWWAAWLGSKDQSVVFCGAGWNAGDLRPPRNLIPPAWRKV